MPQTPRKQTHLSPALRLLPDDLAFLHGRLTNQEAFTLPPAPWVLVSFLINDRRALETAAWQGDLEALARLIRRDSRYMGCPWTLAVASELRLGALVARTRQERVDCRGGLAHLAKAWIGLDQRGRHIEPWPSMVARVGEDLTETYTEAMADRSIRFSEALKRAERKFRELRIVPAQSDRWLIWLKEDLEHLRGNRRLKVKTVVTNRLEKVFKLPPGRAKTLWKRGQTELGEQAQGGD